MGAMAVSSISVSNDTKAEFDTLKPENMTHDEFAQTLLETYRMQDTELVIDELVDRLTDEISDSVATESELAAYRGCKDALEQVIE